MRLTLTLCVVVGLAGTNARAESFGLQQSKLHLMPQSDYHGSAPRLAPAPPAALNPLNPVRGSAVLLGLSLVGAGLVLGGGGFAVLYLCREGTGCHNETTTIVGWVLAAPGIIPLLVGAIILYGSSGRSDLLMPSNTAGKWAFGFSTLSGGGLLNGSVRF